MEIAVTLDDIKSGLKRRLGHSRFYAALRLVRHLVGPAERRNISLLRLRRPRNLFQPYSTTSEDRYPQIFGVVRDQLGDSSDLRLLSFGCANGEEVWSLRRYFPLAHIKGMDINPRNIGHCNVRLRRCPDPRLSFEAAGSAEREPPAFFDAIFAMAVFRHGDLYDVPPRCDHLIDFADFDRVVSGLADCVKPGGLLVIRHANFRFGDTGVSAQFTPIMDDVIVSPQKLTPLYGRDNRLLDGVVDPIAIYRKLGSSALA